MEDATAVAGASGEQAPVDSTGGTPGTTPDQATSTESFSAIDPATLTPELQALYKSMQADYTKKTQGLSSKEKEYTSFQSKAQAFDELMNNPKFSKLAESVNAPDPTEPAPPPLSGEALIAQILENPDSLKEMIRAEAQNLYGPLADRYYGELASKEIEGLKGKYSDFGEYEDQIASVLEKDQSGVLQAEQVYKMLAYDKVKQQGINEGVKALEQRGHAAAPPTSAATVSPNERVNSIFEAFTKAKNAQG